MKVGISYGFAEGPRHAKEMVKLLRQNGFTITRKLREAEVIIAHSGGCYMLPEDGRANIVMLVDVPYWPNKHPRLGLKEKLALEIKDSRWYKKTLLNTLYFVAHPVRWHVMYQGWKNVRIPRSGSTASVIAVRNEHDTFMHPVESEVLASKHGWQTKVLPGHHDDIWRNPERYVKILLDKLGKK